MADTASLAAFAAALAPALVLSLWLWVIDRGRTPSDLAGQALAVGALAAPAILLPAWLIEFVLVGSVTETEQASLKHGLLSAAVAAPLIEEAGRLWVVALVLARHEDFGPKLFIVVAGWASLGFASLENAGYLILREDWGLLALMRAVTSVPAHLIFGIVMGAFLFAYARTGRRMAVALAFAAPMVLHGLYNGAVVLAEHRRGDEALFAFPAVLLMLAFALVLSVRPLLRDASASDVVQPWRRLVGLTLGSVLIGGGILIAGASTAAMIWDAGMRGWQTVWMMAPAIVVATLGIVAVRAVAGMTRRSASVSRVERPDASLS